MENPPPTSATPPRVAPGSPGHGLAGAQPLGDDFVPGGRRLSKPFDCPGARPPHRRSTARSLPQACARSLAGLRACDQAGAEDQGPVRPRAGGSSRTRVTRAPPWAASSTRRRSAASSEGDRDLRRAYRPSSSAGVIDRDEEAIAGAIEPADLAEELCQPQDIARRVLVLLPSLFPAPSESFSGAPGSQRRAPGRVIGPRC